MQTIPSLSLPLLIINESNAFRQKRREKKMYEKVKKWKWKVLPRKKRVNQLRKVGKWKKKRSKGWRFSRNFFSSIPHHLSTFFSHYRDCLIAFSLRKKLYLSLTHTYTLSKGSKWRKEVLPLSLLTPYHNKNERKKMNNKKKFPHDVSWWWGRALYTRVNKARSLLSAQKQRFF